MAVTNRRGPSNTIHLEFTFLRNKKGEASAAISCLGEEEAPACTTARPG